jgi:hypothetical protein
LRIQILLAVLAVIAMSLPQFAAANPPAHAPAHGHRAKQSPAALAPQRPGVEVHFDSERGIHVAVGLPDVFFHDGQYYRERNGHWEISLSGDEGWQFSVSSKIPGAIVDARKKSHPGRSSKKKHSKHR